MKVTTYIGLGVLLITPLVGCAGMEGLVGVPADPSAVPPVADLAVTTGLSAISAVPVIGPLLGAGGLGGLLWRQYKATKRNRALVKDAVSGGSDNITININGQTVEKIKERFVNGDACNH